MKRSTTVLLFLFLAWCVAFCVSAVQAEGEMPQILYVSNADAPYPRWVAAEAAFDSRGEVITDLCDPGSCIILKSLAETPPDPVKGCIEREEAYELLWDPPDRSTFSKSVKNSQLVFFGKVVNKAFGFMGGTPGQLIRVAPTRDFKGVRVLDHYYFFFPVGNFMAGGYRICKIDRSYPIVPERGDEVLLMVPRLEDPNEPLVDIWGGEGVVLVHKKPGEGGDGEVHFSRSFQSLSETIQRREELVEAVETALEQGE